jgi:hypothetical protein
VRALGEALVLYALVESALSGGLRPKPQKRSVMAFRCDWWEKGRAIAKGPASRSIGQA